MTTPSDHWQEPADLSELAATDALLDRLGARNASADDLLDPSVAALAELLAVIDESRDPDIGAARLVEVLAGRPLYIAGADPVVGGIALVSSADGDGPAPRVIDLTQLTQLSQAEGAAGEPDADPAAATAATVADDGETAVTAPITLIPAPGVIPIRRRLPAAFDAQSWPRALRHASLPAASVLVLLAVGGGVSAAVTGDPMTPVNGISRVMAQLPGVNDNGSVDEVQSEIKLARRAVSKQDAPSATRHLNNAWAGLDDVGDADKSQLTRMINEVLVLVPTATTPVPTASIPGIPGGAAPQTSPAVVTSPSASADPVVTATLPAATAAPSADPVATDVPESPAPAATSNAPAADPTPAPGPSSP